MAKFHYTYSKKCETWWKNDRIRYWNEKIIRVYIYIYMYESFLRITTLRKKLIRLFMIFVYRKDKIGTETIYSTWYILPGTSHDFRLGSPSLSAPPPPPPPPPILGLAPQKLAPPVCFPIGESWLLWWYCRGGSGWGEVPDVSCKGCWMAGKENEGKVKGHAIGFVVVSTLQ